MPEILGRGTVAQYPKRATALKNRDAGTLREILPTHHITFPDSSDTLTLLAEWVRGGISLR